MTREVKLTVALDYHGYRLRELSLLEEVVSEAAVSRLNGASIGRESDAVSVTVWNAKRDSGTLDVVRKVAREHEMSLEISPAEAFWVRLSEKGATTPSVKRLEQSSLFEGYIKSLRPGLPGVAILQDGDTVTVQADSPDFGKTLARALHHAFLITQATPTSWRVSWDKQFLSQAFPVEEQQELVSKTAEAVRSFLGDPLELEVYSGGNPDKEDASGVHFLVLNPAQHQPFIDSVRKVFGQDQLFVLSEIEATDARFIRPKSQRQSTEALDFDLMGAVQNALAPQIKLRIEDDGVIVEAKDPVHNGDVAAVVQQALAGRSDLVVKPRSNAGLRVELASKAHLGAALPAMSGSDFLKSVAVQIEAAGVHPKEVMPVGSERAQIIFATQDDAEKLRTALSRPSGLTIRMVDEQPNGVTNSAPSKGDTKLKLPTGEEIWVTPQAIVTGDMIADAMVTENKFTQLPVVQFRLTDEGRSRFAAATRLHLGKRFAIVVNGTAVSAPIINSPILGGTAEVHGNFTVNSANTLLESILPHRNDLLLTVE